MAKKSEKKAAAKDEGADTLVMKAATELPLGSLSQPIAAGAPMYPTPATPLL